MYIKFALVKHPHDITRKSNEMDVEERQENAAVEPLSPFSRFFHSPDFNCFIIITFGWTIRCNRTATVEGLKETLINHPRFSSRLEMGHGNKGEPVWVRTNVNVEDHVIVPDVDPDMEHPDQFLEDYISNLTVVPMDLSKPLWECHLLDIKTSSDSKSICVMRFHHSLGDGMSLMSLLLACARKTLNSEALPTFAAKKKHVNKKHVGPSTCCNWIWWLIARFWFLVTLVFNTCVDFFKGTLTICFLSDTRTPLMGKPSAGLEPKRIVHRLISFDDVKLVKNAMKTSVNDVLLGMTQAGLSRYLSRIYANQGTTTKPKKLLERIRLRGAIFVNLRPNTRIEDLAEMMAKGSECRWGNFIGYVLLPFSVRLEEDPMEYIRRAKAAMDRKKHSLEAVLSYIILRFTMNVFGFKAVEDVAKKVFRRTTLTYSNVVGPDEEISLFGHPISYVAASALGHPHALVIHFQSYVNKIIVSVAVDPTVVEDPHRLCDDMVEYLDTTKSALSERESHKIDV